VTYSQFLEGYSLTEYYMLFKICKTSPLCPKWLLGNECKGKSQLPYGEYTVESQLPYDEYTWESPSWCIWNNHQNRFTKKLTVGKKTRE
jgi:hypothetical protein